MAFAEPQTGQILTVPSNEKNLTPREPLDEASNALEEIDLNNAPKYLQKEMKNMLAKHGKMRDGSLGVIHATEHAMASPSGTVPIRE